MNYFRDSKLNKLKFKTRGQKNPISNALFISTCNCQSSFSTIYLTVIL